MAAFTSLSTVSGGSLSGNTFTLDTASSKGYAVSPKLSYTRVYFEATLNQLVPVTGELSDSSPPYSVSEPPVATAFMGVTISGSSPVTSEPVVFYGITAPFDVYQFNNSAILAQATSNGNVNSASGAIVSAPGTSSATVQYILPQWSVGTTVGCAVDFLTKNFWVIGPNGLWNNSSTASPTIETSGYSFSSLGNSAFAVCIGGTNLSTNSSASSIINITANFGSSPFVYNPPQFFLLQGNQVTQAPLSVLVQNSPDSTSHGRSSQAALSVLVQEAADSTNHDRSSQLSLSILLSETSDLNNHARSSQLSLSVLSVDDTNSYNHQRASQTSLSVLSQDNTNSYNHQRITQSSLSVLYQSSLNSFYHSRISQESLSVLLLSDSDSSDHNRASQVALEILQLDSPVSPYHDRATQTSLSVLALIDSPSTQHARVSQTGVEVLRLLYSNDSDHNRASQASLSLLLAVSHKNNHARSSEAALSVLVQEMSPTSRFHERASQVSLEVLVQHNPTIRAKRRKSLTIVIT